MTSNTFRLYLLVLMLCIHVSDCFLLSCAGRVSQAQSTWEAYWPDAVLQPGETGLCFTCLVR